MGAVALRIAAIKAGLGFTQAFTCGIFRNALISVANMYPLGLPLSGQAAAARPGIRAIRRSGAVPGP